MTFLCAFLVTVFVLYALIPSQKAKNALLLLFSLVFYAVGEPVYILLMLASSVVNYVLALFIEKSEAKKKAWMAVAVVLNIGTLLVFKYTDFLLSIWNQVFHASIPYPHIKLPVGISFFTFQALSYVIDVKRGDCKACRSYPDVLLYISFFPQLIAGPIVKYHDMEGEIKNRTQTWEDVAYGSKRFILGLSKKVLLANNLAYMVDSIMEHEGELTLPLAWVFALGYTLQIYYDFSGYSDMAIGLGRMFGFHFKENFNYPYGADGIKDFWRRWHISLSTWFKEYVYIPLGGNRKGKLRTYGNKFLVFLLTGAWHGASWTFVFWGLWHGVFSVLEDSPVSIRRLKHSVLRRIYTLLVVVVGFVFFRADSLAQGFHIVGRMFVPTGDGQGRALLFWLFDPYRICVFVLALLFCVPWWKRKTTEKEEKGSDVLYALEKCGLLLLLLLCMLALASDSYNPFIYFRF